MIDKLFNRQSTNDIETRMERITWIFEHMTEETKNEMLVSVIIEISSALTFSERKMIQRIIERYNELC